MFGQSCIQAHASHTAMRTTKKVRVRQTCGHLPLIMEGAGTTGGQTGMVTIGAPTIALDPPPLSVALTRPPVAAWEARKRGDTHSPIPMPLPSPLHPATCSEGAAFAEEEEALRGAVDRQEVGGPVACRGAVLCKTPGSDPPTSPTSPHSPPTPSAAVAPMPSSAPTLLADHTFAPSPPTAPTWRPQLPSIHTSVLLYRRQGQMEKRIFTLEVQSVTSQCPRDRTPLTSQVLSLIPAPWDARIGPIRLGTPQTLPCQQ